MTESDYNTLNDILNNIKRSINYISDLSYNEKDQAWSCLYKIVFSKNVSKKVFAICDLDYCDPDTTYEDDVVAFYNALSDHLDQLRPDNMTKSSGNIENDLNDIFGIKKELAGYSIGDKIEKNGHGLIVVGFDKNTYGEECFVVFDGEKSYKLHPNNID